VAARTNSEKVEAAEREILKQGHLLRHFEERYRIEVSVLQSESRAATDQIHQLVLKVAVLEQRILTTEKLLDESRTRRWQVWLAFFSAAMSAVVAIVVAFAKR